MITHRTTCSQYLIHVDGLLVLLLETHDSVTCCLSEHRLSKLSLYIHTHLLIEEQKALVAESHDILARDVAVVVGVHAPNQLDDAAAWDLRRPVQ